MAGANEALLAALEAEKAGYERYGRKDRVADVEELRKAKPPARSKRPAAKSDDDGPAIR